MVGVLVGCALGAEPVAPAGPSPSPPQLTIPPPVCDQPTLTAVLRTSDAIAAALGPSATALRPVCWGDYAWARVDLGGSLGPPVVFVRRLRGWDVLDLGDVSCSDPPPELPAAVCEQLSAAWK